ncbi:sugar transferase [Candidatus Endobugula sertula]|uniref:Sugar transferase n=1 Tax=Candidatus Endobugula sertula TaxID=62101 RepID=A0A1D2QPA9_9GAMM|nr:sugar transferase [Candidatus Endobugula sertula]
MTHHFQPTGLSTYQQVIKRLFDFSSAFLGLLLVWPIILIAALLSSFDTKANGFFIQKRVGRNGKIFHLLKIRTMRIDTANTSTVTTRSDARITRLGTWFRRFKIDELPQLVNVLLGHMSLVGPRPDVPGYADQLIGSDRIILSIRPGITGPASLKYVNEEELLNTQDNPEKYNNEVIWPDKVTINKEYIMHYSFIDDIKYIIKTLRA